MDKLVHKVIYNSQRDNQTVGGIPGSSQCGYACACMLISTVIPAAANDYWVAEFVDSMEPNFGKKGIGEYILSLPMFSWLRNRRAGSYMPAYEIAIRNHLDPHGYSVIADYDCNINTVKKALAHSPVMIGTKITDSGHFILLVGYDDSEGCFIVHDPYGNAIKGYSNNRNGAYVRYGYEWLSNRVNNLNGEMRKWRAIWIKKKNT